MNAHIVRIDQRHTHAWQVRLDAAEDSPRNYDSKLFSDKLHGGKRKAKRAAEEYLTEQLAERGLERPPRGRRKGMMFPEDTERTCSMNTSGRTGVYHSYMQRRGSDGQLRTQRYWAAYVTIGASGKSGRFAKRFYYGTIRSEEEAKELAVDFRAGWEEAYLDGGVRAVRRFFKEWQG